jgi:hypothetical protein
MVRHRRDHPGTDAFHLVGSRENEVLVPLFAAVLPPGISRARFVPPPTQAEAVAMFDKALR